MEVADNGYSMSRHRRNRIEDSDSDEDIPIAALIRLGASKDNIPVKTEKFREEVNGVNKIETIKVKDELINNIKVKSERTGVATPVSKDPGHKSSATEVQENDIKREVIPKVETPRGRGAYTRIKRDGDSEDDQVLSKLKTSKIKTEAKEKKRSRSSESSKRRKDKKKSKKRKASHKSSSTPTKKSKPNSSDAAGPVKERTERLYATLKGLLVQKLLVRWNYALEWPTKTDYKLSDEEMPLDGFPGVSIVVKGERIGKVIDRRDPEGKPCFDNFYRKPASELQRLATKAIKKQMEILIEHEGKESPIYPTLKRELKEVEHINILRADKQAEKLRKLWEPYGV